MFRFFFRMSLLLFIVICASSIYSEQALEGRQHPMSKEEQALAQKAKLSFAEAKEIALKKEPGTIFNWELENEDGKLIYSIQVQLPDDKEFSREINVDAMNGKIISIEKENLKQQLKAAQTEPN
jgi:uncharacterized membrane protein YkoI